MNGVTTNYKLQGSNIIFEQTNDNMIYYIYDASGNVIGLKYNNDIYYYEKNIQNDITGIMDDSFNLLATYEYDSWGNILSIKDTNGNAITDSTNIALVNPFRYRSYYYDSEIGMYYLNSRYYNSEWGRFINVDTVINTYGTLSDTNMFSYADNNPINRIDNNGTLWDTILDIIGIGSDIVDLVKKPSWSKVGWLSADLGLALVPFVPNTGALKIGAKVANGANKVDKAYDIGKRGEDAVSAALSLKKNTQTFKMGGKT